MGTNIFWIDMISGGAQEDMDERSAAQDAFCKPELGIHIKRGAKVVIEDRRMTPRSFLRNLAVIPNTVISQLLLIINRNDVRLSSYLACAKVFNAN